MQFIRRFFFLLLRAIFIYWILYVVYGFIIGGFKPWSHCHQTLIGNIIVDSVIQILIFSFISLITLFLLWLISKYSQLNIFYTKTVLCLILIIVFGILIEMVIPYLFNRNFDSILFLLFPSNICY